MSHPVPEAYRFAVIMIIDKFVIVGDLQLKKAGVNGDDVTVFEKEPRQFA